MPIVKPGGCLKVSEFTGAREDWKVKKREAKKKRKIEIEEPGKC